MKVRLLTQPKLAACGILVWPASLRRSERCGLSCTSPHEECGRHQLIPRTLCHWRTFPLVYCRNTRAKKFLKKLASISLLGVWHEMSRRRFELQPRSDFQ